LNASPTGWWTACGHDSEPPQAHAADAQAGQVVQPGAGAAAEVRDAGEPGVGEPQLDVLVGVEDLALDDQGVAAGGGDPPGEALVPGLVGDGPVGQHLERAALGQALRAARDDAPDQVVARQRRLAVGEPGVRRRAHHVGGVADDEVEGVGVDRVVQRAEPQVGVHPGEEGAQPRQLEGARVDVGRDDPVGVTRQVEGLDAAARAQVEGGAHGGPDRQLGQRRGRRGDPEDEVGPHRDDAAVQTRVEVVADPPRPVLGAVGADLEGGAHGVRGFGGGDDAGGAAGVPGGAEGGAGVRLGDGELQHQQPDEGGLGVAAAPQRVLGGEGGVAFEARGARGTQPVEDGVEGVRRVGEATAQGERGVGGQHGPTRR